MKSLSEITDFYYKDLYPILTKLEKERSQLKYRIVVVFIIYSLIYFLLSFYISSIFFLHIDLLVGLGFVYFAIAAFIYKFLIKDYKNEFKLKIIQPLIHEIDSNLNYYKDSHIGEHTFKKSKLFTSNPDRFSGNDYVKGKIDDINIEFSDVHAEKKEKNSKGKSHWSTIFQGLFIVTEFNKHFHSETIVLPDTAESSFGNVIGSWLQSKNINRDELVKMDDPEFEKEFVVYSNNQVEARYILSHSLMHRLLQFQKKSKHPLYISFINGFIYIAIEYNSDLFEPSIFSSLLNYKIAMEYIQTLHLAIGIIDELKLNEKLWSKQ